jgi:hypothetical protein
MLFLYLILNLIIYVVFAVFWRSDCSLDTSIKILMIVMSLLSAFFLLFELGYIIKV